LQLESGKVIAIRASIKGGQPVPGVEQKLGSFAGLPEVPERPKFQVPRNDGDVIDISNDDDEEESPVLKSILPDIPAVALTNDSSHAESLPTSSSDTVYKEKVVYKPNLVQRSKPKMPPPSIPVPDSQPLKRFDSPYQSQQQRQPLPKWDAHKNFSSNPNMFNRSANGSSKNSSSVPFRNGEKTFKNFKSTIPNFFYLSQQRKVQENLKKLHRVPKPPTHQPFTHPLVFQCQLSRQHCHQPLHTSHHLLTQPKCTNRHRHTRVRLIHRRQVQTTIIIHITMHRIRMHRQVTITPRKHQPRLQVSIPITRRIKTTIR
jgi:hypothetical protein